MLCNVCASQLVPLQHKPGKDDDDDDYFAGGSGRLAWHLAKMHPFVHLTVYDTPSIIDSIRVPFLNSMNLEFVKGMLRPKKNV